MHRGVFGVVVGDQSGGNEAEEYHARRMRCSCEVVKMSRTRGYNSVNMGASGTVTPARLDAPRAPTNVR